jgi:hypothetical protein
MGKFRHLDEEEYVSFCGLCQYEHDSSVPERVCKENARIARDAARGRLGRKRDDDEDDDE